MDPWTVFLILRGWCDLGVQCHKQVEDGSIRGLKIDVQCGVKRVGENRTR